MSGKRNIPSYPHTIMGLSNRLARQSTLKLSRNSVPGADSINGNHHGKVDRTSSNTSLSTVVGVGHRLGAQFPNHAFESGHTTNSGGVAGEFNDSSSGLLRTGVIVEDNGISHSNENSNHDLTANNNSNGQHQLQFGPRDDSQIRSILLGRTDKSSISDDDNEPTRISSAEETLESLRNENKLLQNINYTLEHSNALSRQLVNKLYRRIDSMTLELEQALQLQHSQPVNSNLLESSDQNFVGNSIRVKNELPDRRSSIMALGIGQNNPYHPQSPHIVFQNDSKHISKEKNNAKQNPISSCSRDRIDAHVIKPWSCKQNQSKPAQKAHQRFDEEFDDYDRDAEKLINHKEANHKRRDREAYAKSNKSEKSIGCFSFLKSKDKKHSKHRS